LIILGIDPGITSTGYGVVKIRTGQPEMESYGVIGPEAGMTVHQRLNYIYEGIVDVIRTYKPDHIAIEDVFYSKNIRSTLTIGQARGVAILASVRAGIHVSEYAPREVKRAVVGSGAASKEQVQFMIKKLLHLDQHTITSDAADALAIALCHANRIKVEELIKRT
jgi:crossover junction endodeoxyribonuclease RuvC